MFGFKKKPTPEPVKQEEDSPVYKASMPRTRVEGYFIPLQDFEGFTDRGELLGQYKKGKTYYLRKGNVLLKNLCDKWQSENLITVIGA
jgi:hypothetical protein